MPEYLSILWYYIQYIGLYTIPLWCLIAVLQTYILWYFVVKSKKEKLFVYTLPILFLAQFVSTSYVETLELSWCLKINFVTRALSWFLLGYYINANKEYIVKVKNNIISFVGLLGLSIALSHILLKTTLDCSCIGIFLYSVALFVTGIKYSDLQISNILVYIGKNLSLYIYIFHTLIGSLIIFLTKIMLNVDIKSTWYTPIVVVIVTTLFSYIIYKIKFILNMLDIQHDKKY